MAAYDFLVSQPEVQSGKVIGIGSSLGAYLLTRLSERRPLQALALRVPANFPDKFDEVPMNDQDIVGPHAIAWRARELPAGETAAMRALAKFSGSVLLIEAENDTVVPRQTVENLRRSVTGAPLCHLVVQGAPHVLYSDPRASLVADAAIQSWLTEQADLISVQS